MTTDRDGKPLRVAMVGLGWAARAIWLPRLQEHPRLAVAAVVDPDSSARSAAAADGLAAYPTVDLLPPDSVDLAVVAVPNHLHTPVASALLSAGIPVFLEKPVCLTTAEADQLAAAEQAGGAVLLAGSAARYRADVRTLIEQAAAGVGEIRHLNLEWVRARGIPNGVGWFTQRQFAGGGALVDLGWHLLDAVSPLLGKPRYTQVIGAVSDDFINDSTAHAQWRRDQTAASFGDVEDTARGFLITDSQISVSLTACWASHQPTDVTTIIVHGSAGKLSLRCTFGFSPNREPGSTLTLTRGGETSVIPIPDEPIGTEYDRLLDELPVRLADPASRGVAIGEASRTIGAIERLYASAATSQDQGRTAFPALLRRATPTRAVVFDLDGVLVDSFAVMRTAFEYAYAQVVGPGPAPFEEYNKHLGRYFPDIMRLMGLPLEMEEPFVSESTRLAGQVRMFPGVRELLQLLRDRHIGLAVATGKSGWRARALLAGLGVLDLFDHVIGSDEVPRSKPAPDIVLRALDLLQLAPADAVMVGDAVTDLVCAQSAGVTAIAALWGETDEAALLAAGPDLTLRCPADLLPLCPSPAVRLTTV
jgi:3-amino-5-hydroxybenzoic acid synthesis related protein